MRIGSFASQQTPSLLHSSSSSAQISPLMSALNPSPIHLQLDPPSLLSRKHVYLVLRNLLLLLPPLPQLAPISAGPRRRRRPPRIRRLHLRSSRSQSMLSTTSATASKTSPNAYHLPRRSPSLASTKKIFIPTAQSSLRTLTRQLPTRRDTHRQKFQPPFRPAQQNEASPTPAHDF